MGKNYFIILLCIGTETMTITATTVPKSTDRDGGTTAATTPSLLGKCTRRKLQAPAASDIIMVEIGEKVLTLGKKLKCCLCLNRLF